MRRTLLVPTDFSNNAFVATTYTLGLAKLLNADVHIIHAYRPLYSVFQRQLANETEAQRAGSKRKSGGRIFYKNWTMPAK